MSNRVRIRAIPVDRLGVARRASCRREPGRSTATPTASCRCKGIADRGRRPWSLPAFVSARRLGVVLRGSGWPWSGAPCRRRQELLAVGRDRDGRRIPAGRDEALDLAPAGRGDVDDRHAVVVGIGDVERLAVGRNRQARRACSPREPCGNRAVWIVSVTIPAPVSITETQLLEAQATKSRSSLG